MNISIDKQVGLHRPNTKYIPQGRVEGSRRENAANVNWHGNIIQLAGKNTAEAGQAMDDICKYNASGN